MKPTSTIIREKLRLYRKWYISIETLEKILSKFAPNYTVSQLCDKRLITPIKRGKWYINNESTEYIDPYIVWSLYMGDAPYMFGGLAVYNSYSLSTQVPEWYTILNTSISWERRIGSVKLIFTRQRESFFYGGEMRKQGEYSYTIMSPERAFIEMLKEKKKFSTLPYGIDREKLISLARENASKTINTTIQQICSSIK